MDLAIIKNISMVASILGDNSNPLKTLAKHALDKCIHDVFPDDHPRYFYDKTNALDVLLVDNNKKKYDSGVEFVKALVDMKLLNADQMVKVLHVIDPSFYLTSSLMNGSTTDNSKINQDNVAHEPLSLPDNEG